MTVWQWCDMTITEQDYVIGKQNGRTSTPNGRVLQPETASSATLPPNIPPTAPAFRTDGRTRRILLFFGSAILHFIGLDVILSRIPLIGDWIRMSRPRRLRWWAFRFRILALDMGGVMIKLGQFLSARVDVLPSEITDELKGLQDEVPPEPIGRIIAVLQEELGDYHVCFAAVEEEPLAAASLGQAHRAWLWPEDGQSGLGDAVVIKVQRPNIQQIVRTDLSALRVVARWINRYRPIRKRADVPALMEEFAKTLRDELDYELEADNAERFAIMYADNAQIYIPAVYRQYSTKRVITLENVEGIKITDVLAMQAAGIDPDEVANCLLDTYFYQIFYEGFFHADPHPGNLFVLPRLDLPWPPPSVNGDESLETGRPFWLIFVDFGMVGVVPEMMKTQLRKALIAVMQRDSQALTEAYADLGFFLAGADLDRIVEAQDVVLKRIWGRSWLDLAQPDPEEVQEFSREFKDLLFEFPFQVPQDFIYLGRALGIVAGLVSLLNEEINPWYYFDKYGQELLQDEEINFFSLETAWEVIRPYLSTPAQVQRLLNLAESGRLRVQTDRETLRYYDKIERRIGQIGWSILGAAGILSATLLYLNRKKNPPK